MSLKAGILRTLSWYFEYIFVSHIVVGHYQRIYLHPKELVVTSVPIRTNKEALPVDILIENLSINITSRIKKLEECSRQLTTAVDENLTASL